MTFSRAAFIALDSAVAFLWALVAALAVYWATGAVLPELGIEIPIDQTGLFTLEQWDERYMRTMLVVCVLSGALATAWAVLGSAVWSGRQGDGRLTWVLLCAGAGVAAAVLGWLNLPMTSVGGNSALLLQASAGVATVWLATLFGAPRNFRYTPLGSRWVRSRLPW